METKLYQVINSTNDPFYNQLGLLSQIVIGGFPIDIGTSLAFESLFTPIYEPYDPDREIPDKIDITQYKFLMINIETLFRNLFSALHPDEARIIRPEQYEFVLNYEINFINNLVYSTGKVNTKVVFYYCHYKNIYNTKWPLGVRVRLPHTEKQILYNKLLDSTIKLLLKDKESNITIFNNSIDKHYNGKTLIITSTPYDLFSYKKFSTLDLLESYTGVLKTRVNWPSKYYQGSKFLNIPFNSKLYKILGDNEMFHPFPIKYRRDIKDLADKYNWNPLTSESQITHDIIRHLDNKELIDTYKKLVE